MRNLLRQVASRGGLVDVTGQISGRRESRETPRLPPYSCSQLGTSYRVSLLLPVQPDLCRPLQSQQPLCPTLLPPVGG